MNYLVLAMKRSGHHAIMNWIQAFTRQPIYNNCCFGWPEKKLLTMRGRKEAVDGITNIEDFNSDYWKEYDFPSFQFLEDCKVIVFIRNLSNWLASSYVRKLQDNEERKDVYKYLRVSYTNDSKLKSPSRIDIYCKQLVFADSRFVVTFEEFINDRMYRMKIADMLKLKWNANADASIKIPSAYGGGSSFNGLLKCTTNVLNRERYFKDDSEFQSLLKYAKNKINKIGKSNVSFNK